MVKINGSEPAKFDVSAAPEFDASKVQFDIGRLSGREIDSINDVLLERKSQFRRGSEVLAKYIKVAPAEWGDVSDPEVLYDLPRDYLNGMIIKLIGELNGKN